MDITPHYEAFEAAIGSARSRSDATKAYAKLLRGAEDAERQLLEREGIQFACCDGCFYCCHLRVEAKPYEVFLIAERLAATRSTMELGHLVGRLKSHVDRVSAMGEDEHLNANVPCPLLVDGRCSVYAVRPQGCRSCHSLSVDPCRQFFEDPSTSSNSKPTVVPVKELWAMGWLAAGSVFDSHGFDTTAHELGSALLLALSNPSHGRRWWDRKRAFPSLSCH